MDAGPTEEDRVELVGEEDEDNNDYGEGHADAVGAGDEEEEGKEASAEGGAELDAEDKQFVPRRLRKVTAIEDDDDDAGEGSGDNEHDEKGEPHIDNEQDDYAGEEFTHRPENDDDDDEEYKPPAESGKDKAKKKREKARRNKGEHGNGDDVGTGEKKRKKRRKDKDKEMDGEEPKRKGKKRGVAHGEGTKRPPKRKAAAIAEQGEGMPGALEGEEGEGEELTGRISAAVDADADEDDDSHEAPQATEAGSKSDFDAMLDRMKHKRRKKDRDQHELNGEAKEFVERMEKAAADDTTQHRNGQPAVSKVAMMAEVESMCKKEFMHEVLLDNGILVALSNWLAPKGDGTMPNESVRTVALRSLNMFDCDDVFKERLKASMVGRYVVLYSKHSDECTENRRIALGLIEKWMRPIYRKTAAYSNPAKFAVPKALGPVGPSQAPEEEREAAQRDVLEAQSTGAKPGDKDFRVRAAIPDALNMDFKVMPKSTAMPLPSKKHDKESTKGKIAGKLLMLKRGKGGKNLQAEKISIEGRHL